MTGARRLAMDYIVPRCEPGQRVLDVGAGDGWLSHVLGEKGCDVTAVDRVAISASTSVKQCLIRDLRIAPWAIASNSFDVVVAVYSLQHLLGDEAQSWLEIKRVLRPGGVAHIVGRANATHSGREMNRADALTGYSGEGLTALALATGLDVQHYETMRYEGDDYQRSHFAPNAFCLTLGKPDVR